MKAWKTVLCSVTSIVFAETSGKAKAATLMSAKDGGYKYVFFTEVKCRRAPEYDRRLFKNGDVAASGTCHAPHRLMTNEPVIIAQAKEQMVSL